MDELFATGIKLAYTPEHSAIFINGDEKEVSKIQINKANCPSFWVCVEWAKFHKNVSFLFADESAEVYYANGDFVGENSEHLVCGLEDGVVLRTGLTMIMFIGDPLMRRFNEIINRVVEGGIYNYWFSLRIDRIKIYTRKIGIFYPLDGYYSFNLYHIQPVFYLLLMGWSISALCLMIEVMYNRVLIKGK
jgi:hypothetical protein